MKVRLEVAKPVNAIVTEGEIPPFNVPPDVIFWGTRVFKLKVHNGVAVTSNDRLIYVEAFAYYLTLET